MKHVVLGNGNLANSLIQEISKRKEEFHHFHRQSGSDYSFDYPRCEFFNVHNFGMGQDSNEWIVWNAIGMGSIVEANKDFGPSLDAHLRLPAELEQSLDEGVTIVNFSSDYASQPELSRYAFSKAIMEDYINKFARPKTFCIRVANLYGSHRPEGTLPYKLLHNQDKIDSLPENIIAPTPTEWLSARLMEIDWEELESKSQDTRVWHLAPIGISVREFGELLFGRKLGSSGFDRSRPMNYYMGSDFGKAYVNQLWENSDLKKLLEAS